MQQGAGLYNTGGGSWSVALARYATQPGCHFAVTYARCSGANQEVSDIQAERILTAHALFGLLGVVAAVWVFAELLNASEQNSKRTTLAGIAVTALMWLSFLLGGYWYVSYYAADKAVVLAGPRPWAHTVGMESKEHLFFIVLCLATYIPAVVRASFTASDRSLRGLALFVAGSIVVLGVAMERLGSIVSMGVRMGLHR